MFDVPFARAPLRVVVTGHFARPASHHMRREAPEDFLAIWVVGGWGWGRTPHREASARPGDLLVFEPGVVHEYAADAADPWDILWIHFTGPAALLRETAMTVQEVAAAVGYDDPYDFSRLFRKHLGMAPSAYRGSTA